MTDSIRIATDLLSAEISPIGAELQILRDEAGRDLLWNGDAAFWTGRAPLLFPIVGAVNHDTIRVDDKEYTMHKHGFARRQRFDVVGQTSNSVTFRLDSDATTRACYPFEFRLDVTFAIEAATLSTSVMLTNISDCALPASFGFHPAFRWPLPWGGARSEHKLIFAESEPAPIRRIDTKTGLVLPEAQPTPVDGDVLVPRDDLFEPDALIFDQLNARRVRFGVPGRRMLEVAFPDMPLLGVWTKPGAPYLCIEPWQGLADPQDFAGDFRDKPYVVEVAPGAARRFAMDISLVK